MNRLALILVPVGALGVVLPACLACNDIGCAGGFEWTAGAQDGTALEPGTYEVTLTLEDDTYEVTCEVAEKMKDSNCSEPSHTEGEVDYSLTLDIQQHDPGDWNPDSPVGGFYLSAVDASGGDPDGSYSENRGPTLVAIEIVSDGDTLIDESYDVTYERNEDYRGDPRCGFCDEVEEREANW